MPTSSHTSESNFLTAEFHRRRGLFWYIRAIRSCSAHLQSARLFVSATLIQVATVLDQLHKFLGPELKAVTGESAGIDEIMDRVEGLALPLNKVICARLFGEVSGMVPRCREGADWDLGRSLAGESQPKPCLFTHHELC